MFSEKRVALALLIVLFATQIGMVIARTDRQPHIDEVEYLHAGWLMANGGRIFETFFEHHSPLLFAALAPLAPQAERVEVQPYVERARLLAGFAGLIGLAAFAAVAARGNLMAPVIAIAAFVASGSYWLHVIADVRAEPFALAFFWTGVALVLLPQKRIAVAAGFGIGLVAIAGLWTPKWPLCSLVVAFYAIIRARGGRVVTILIAALMGVSGLAVIQAIAPLDVVRFFTLEFSSALYRRLQEAATPYLLERPFREAPLMFALPIVAGAALLVVVAALTQREAAAPQREGAVLVQRERRVPLFFVALFAAAVLEIRFIHPYPAVWRHNYGLWSLSAAAIFGSVPRAVLDLLRRVIVSSRLRTFTVVALYASLLILLIPNIVIELAFARDDTTYWRSQRALIRRLRPNETVWIAPSHHPITVRDAHYYWFDWFNYHEGIFVVAGELLTTKRGAHYLPPLENLPLCTALRGANRLRLASLPARGVGVDSERACFTALRAAGRVRPAPSLGVFEILPPRR